MSLKVLLRNATLILRVPHREHSNSALWSETVGAGKECGKGDEELPCLGC